MTAQLKRLGLSHEEMSILHYAAGSVPAQLIRQYKKKKMSAEDKYVVACLEGMMEKREVGHVARRESEWTEKIDRGSLFHINAECFDFFLAIERITRSGLHNHIRSSESGKDEFRRSVTSDSEVISAWNKISSPHIPEPEQSAALLDKLVHMWITRRGFSTTSAMLEVYKVAKKKAVSKSKSLRKQIDPTRRT